MQDALLRTTKYHYNTDDSLDYTERLKSANPDVYVFVERRA